MRRAQCRAATFEYLDLYDELRQHGELTLRFYIAYFLDPPGLNPDQIRRSTRRGATYHDDWISGGVVKTMLDGVVEAHTAAMLAPYSDDPSQDRQAVLGPDEVQASGRRT